MRPGLTKAYVALAIISVAWGTTYLAMLIGVKTFPPFIFSGIRQFVAGVILMLFLWLSGRLGKINRKNKQPRRQRI